MIDVTGVRGARVPTGRVLAGGELHGSVPIGEQDHQEPFAVAGRRLPLLGLQTQRVAASHRR